MYNYSKLTKRQTIDRCEVAVVVYASLLWFHEAPWSAWEVRFFLITASFDNFTCEPPKVATVFSICWTAVVIAYWICSYYLLFFNDRWVIYLGECCTCWFEAFVCLSSETSKHSLQESVFLWLSETASGRFTWFFWDNWVPFGCRSFKARCVEWTSCAFFFR